MADKTQHLLQYLDLDRPELAAVRTAADPAQAFLKHVAAQPRPYFLCEYPRKAEILAFLRAHYGAWRSYERGPADTVAALSIEAAKGPRALAGVPLLGQAWWATGDPKYGAAFERFYRAVPTGEMFNWGSFNGSQGTIELKAFFLLLDCPGFTTAGRIAVLDHLFAITENAWDTHTSSWQQLTLGPEGHNWYLHGMSCLPFVGLLFPELKRARFFRDTGWSVIEEHVRGHYKADGGAREATIGYQAGSVQCLWEAYTIARRNGHPMSAGFAERLVNATRFLLNLMTPDGGLPSIGDTGVSPGCLTNIAAFAAALTGDRECKWYAERCRGHRQGDATETPGALPAAVFWSVGLEGAAAYAATRPRDPRCASVRLGPTGYAALRDTAAADASYMAISAADRGPIVTSHCHNDIFSMDVHAAGVRFLGEMGCAPYGTSPGRDYDECTAAHNCVAIEGMEQLRLAGEWRWEERVSPCVRRWISEPSHDFFHGVHEGYYHWPKHMTLHARKIFFVKPAAGGVHGYWIVLDWLESAVENDYRVYFHGCVPGRVEGRNLRFEEKGVQLAVVPPEGDALTVAPHDSPGLRAYIAEKSLVPERYPCFAYARRAASDCFAWVLMPLAAGQALPRVRRLPVTVNGKAEAAYGATAVEVAHGDSTDLLCVSHKDFDSTLAFGTQTTWGFLAFRRFTRDGRITLALEHTMADGTCGR